MKTLRLLVALFTASAGTVCLSQEDSGSEDRGSYVGVGTGLFALDAADIEFDTVAAYKLYYGYRLNENVAIEISYESTERSSANGSLAPLNIGAKLTAYAVRVVGYLPWTETSGLIVSMGSWNGDLDFSGLSADDNDASLVLGIGTKWQLEKFDARLEVNWFDSLFDDAVTIGTSVHYKF